MDLRCELEAINRWKNGDSSLSWRIKLEILWQVKCTVDQAALCSSIDLLDIQQVLALGESLLETLRQNKEFVEFVDLTVIRQFLHFSLTPISLVRYHQLVTAVRRHFEESGSLTEIQAETLVQVFRERRTPDFQGRFLARQGDALIDLLSPLGNDPQAIRAVWHADNDNDDEITIADQPWKKAWLQTVMNLQYVALPWLPYWISRETYQAAMAQRLESWIDSLMDESQSPRSTASPPEVVTSFETSNSTCGETSSPGCLLQ